MQQPKGRVYRDTRPFRSLALAHSAETNRRPLSPARLFARGFTLIEILVVVVILGILAGLIVPRIMDRPDQARVVAAKNDINAITNALKLYRLDNGVYPSADQGLSALVKRPESGDIPRNWKSGGYLERLPKDPWGNDYQYLNPGIHGEVDVLSLGADRQPGGEGYNADIGSWEAEQR
ncbi:MAG: type II secretion system major pseudopilin GspG [Sulfurifustaceae bacterium]